MTTYFDDIKDVGISESGKFKYVLIKVYDTKNNTYKFIVRGYPTSYHANIAEKTTEELEKLGFNVEIVGGGAIKHNQKQILVYGYSMSYGAAKHEITVDLLKKHYPDYTNISCTYEGYL